MKRSLNLRSLIFIIPITILILAVIGGTFYWFQFRPTQIKKNCAKVTSVISEVKEITKEEADLSKQLNDECKQKIVPTTTGTKWYEGMDTDKMVKEFQCDENYPVKTQTGYQPEHQATRDATEEEYSACLRSNGL